MYKILNANKIVGVSEEYPKVYGNKVCGNYEIIEDTEHTIADYVQVDGEYVLKTSDEAFEQRKSERIAELQNHLNATDWYAVRYAETGVAVPEDVKAERQAAREEISRLREESDG